MSTALRVGIYSEASDGSGSDRIPLAALGRTSAITYTSTWPGGDDNLNAKLELDSPLFQHRALAIGRRIRACIAGQTVWYGILDVPDPGQLTCAGRGTLASRYEVVAGASNSTNTQVDAKIGVGLPWQRTASLPTPPDTGPLSLVSLSDWLNSAAATSNQQWAVAADGTVDFSAVASTPSYVLLASDRPGRTAEGFVSMLHAIYIDSTTGARTYIGRSVSAAFGVHEAEVDLTFFGPITNAQAAGYLANLIGRVSARASYTSPFTVEPGRLLTYPGGAAVDLATVRAGAMVRPTGLDPSQLAETNVGPAAADFVIGTSAYDVDTGVLALTPFEDATASTDLQAMVGDLIKYAAV